MIRSTCITTAMPASFGATEGFLSANKKARAEPGLFCSRERERGRDRDRNLNFISYK